MTAVETWHKAKNDTFGAEVLRFPKVLPGHMGIVAVGLLTVIRTWCSENRTHIVPGHVVEALGRMYRLPDKTTGDLLGALTTSHFLTKEANDVLRALATEHNLCDALLGLDKAAPGKPCFGHQIKRCKGACHAIRRGGIASEYTLTNRWPRGLKDPRSRKLVQ